MELVGDSVDGIGVLGTSKSSAGVKGDSQGLDGVQGFTSHGGHYGVVGQNNGGGTGTCGYSAAGIGVAGQSTDSAGVKGDSQNLDGVQGFSRHADHFGVIGDNGPGVGVRGQSTGNDGVQGAAAHVDRAGVLGYNSAGVAVRGISDGHDGVQGFTKSAGRAGVVGVCDEQTQAGNGVYGRSVLAGGVVGTSQSGIAVLGVSEGSALAGRFQGDVEVTGDLRLSGADYAEELTVADVEVTPGMVVVLDDEGRIRPCAQDYDDRVAGVVSGAGNVRPALVLDRHDGGMPVALMGKLWVLADATAHPIRPGDRLTTSDVAGHARRVTDPTRASGAVVGKALTPLDSGLGLVRVLVSAS